MKSQNELILEHLIKGYQLTPLGALKIFQCMRLGARIWDLENGKLDGKFYIISHEMVSKNKKKYSRYFMTKSQIELAKVLRGTHADTQ